MADWRGRGGGRHPSHPPAVVGTGGRGRGGGRPGAQPTITSRGSWAGAGGGPGNPQTVALRLASMVAYELRNYIEGQLGGWVGRGGGHRGRPIKSMPPSPLVGTRSPESTSQMVMGTKDVHVADPQGAYVFCLEIDGVEVAQFLECSGLKASTTVFELEEGGMNHRVHKLPGQSKWDNLQLRYGVTADVSMLGWRGLIHLDEFSNEKLRKNGAIVVKNNEMTVVRRYNFKDAWPVSWEGPAFNSNSNELAIESIELAHSGIEVTKVSN